jgi:hypothetical protein
MDSTGKSEPRGRTLLGETLNGRSERYYSIYKGRFGVPQERLVCVGAFNSFRALYVIVTSTHATTHNPTYQSTFCIRHIRRPSDRRRIQTKVEVRIKMIVLRMCWLDASDDWNRARYTASYGYRKKDKTS